MRIDSCSVDRYVSLLRSCLDTRDVKSGKSVHSLLVKLNLRVGIFLCNNLINFYGKNGLVEDARRLFDEMPERNISSWNTVISMHAKCGQLGVARKLFDGMPERDSISWTAMIVGMNLAGLHEHAIGLLLEMIREGVVPTQFTFTNILASCAALGDLDTGRKVHSCVAKFGLSAYVSVANSLLNMYAKCGDQEVAQAVFNSMRVRSISSWNSLISLYAQSGQIEQARELFETMSDRDCVSWNSVIAGYNQQGFDLQALELFVQMQNHYVRPDSFTLTSTITACANLEFLKTGTQLHAYIIKFMFDSYGPLRNALIAMYSKSGRLEISRKIADRTHDLNVIALTALMHGYIKFGELQLARDVFDSVCDKDVVLWTAMIVGYAQHGLDHDALTLFRIMFLEGIEPNDYTIACLLSVCASSGILDYGKQLHAHVLRNDIRLTNSVSNALVTMYARCGSLIAAEHAFKHAGVHDAVSYTSMIMAKAQHGLGNEAIELFDEMMEQRIKPDHITYIGVLAACSHAGLVDLGRHHFQMMHKKHAIEPQMSHYACMIDLFGRAGLLKEADEFIRSMPVEPDVVVWGALLSACRIHNNVELARRAAEKLLAIEPENSGAYAVIANVYASYGEWQEAAEIRKIMKDRGVKKEPGCSWVQIKKKVHVFGVQDLFHPLREQIYAMVRKLCCQVRELGYQPDTSSVLHDLEEELKEQLLSHHSEKLAVAFGLISTADGSTLRIMKNLRLTVGRQEALFIKAARQRCIIHLVRLLELDK
ncbi:Pentatricopeptide repeat-containing protein [Nymphaea thermarum]|nr:Pentatricopeptide repeat-containing protein [Nymphaea thermarum]